MNFSYKLKLCGVLIVDSEFQIDFNLVFVFQGQGKACWNDLPNEVFHKSFFLLEKSS